MTIVPGWYRWRIIEEIPNKADRVLGAYTDGPTAEGMLTYYLNHGHNAWLMDAEDADPNPRDGGDSNG